MSITKNDTTINYKFTWTKGTNTIQIEQAQKNLTNQEVKNTTLTKG